MDIYEATRYLLILSLALAAASWLYLLLFRKRRDDPTHKEYVVVARWTALASTFVVAVSLAALLFIEGGL